MQRVLLVVLGLLALTLPVLSVHVSEFDSTVADFDQFTQLLELQQTHEEATNEHLSDEELSLLEVSEGEGDDGTNPSYTLPYPAITYAAHAAGGFVHPFSNVNPLAAPWAGFAPVAHPVGLASAAALAASPLSAYYAGAVHPVAAALGVNTALYPAVLQADVKGGYNVHGLNAGNVFGGYHPGLANDLTSLGGKASSGGGDAGSDGGEDSFLESGVSQGQSSRAYPLASDSHDPANMEADAENTAYGLFPAPAPHTSSHFVRSRTHAILGPHKLQFEPVGSNEIDAAFPAFVEIEAAAETEADAELGIESEQEMQAEDAAEAELDTQVDATINEAESAMGTDDTQLLEVSDDGEDEGGSGGDGASGGANPTYVLPYPPILPGHYTPLFNPYTNVNPLSTPFANYAAQPGAHPGVAAAAAAQAGSLAAVNGQIAGAAGGYPYYPFAARNPIVAAQLQGNPVPFSGYAGWIHPQNLNSAAVGENEDAASLGQFLEVATEETDHGECNGCSYN